MRTALARRRREPDFKNIVSAIISIFNAAVESATELTPATGVHTAGELSLILTSRICPSSCAVPLRWRSAKIEWFHRRLLLLLDWSQQKYFLAPADDAGAEFL